jgi:hypothetical protein
MHGPGNRTDVSVSIVNCLDDPEFCHELHVFMTPTALLAIGPKRRLWPSTPSVDPETWTSFIDRHVAPNLFKYLPENAAKKFESIIDSSSEAGGTAFFLKVPTQTDELLLPARRLSSQYHLIGSTFSYVIGGSAASLAVSIGQHRCMIYWDKKSNATEFIEAHKFGPLHQYDIEEWRASVALSDTGMLFVKTDLKGSQRRALRRLAAENCGSVSFGWMALPESRQLLPELGMTEAELPFFAFTRRGSNCHFFSQNRTATLTASGFFSRARDEEVLCDRSTQIPTPIPQFAPTEPNLRSSPNGRLFVAVSFAIGIGLIAVLQARNSQESKSE